MTDPNLFSALDETPLWSAPFGRLLMDTVILRAGIGALDVGCGLGYPALDLAARLGDRSRVVGLDSSRMALDRMVYKQRHHRLHNVTAVLGMAEKLPFADERFDLIVSNNGLNNVHDPAAAFRECYRVASTPSQMVLTVNLPGSMAEFYRIYEKVLTECGLPDRISAMHAQIHTKRNPLAKTCRLITESGFRIESVQEDAFAMRYVDGSAMLDHFVIRVAFLPGFLSILDESEKESVLERLEIRLNEQAFFEGEIKLTIPFVCIDCRKSQ